MEALLKTRTGMIAELAQSELDDINRLSEAVDALAERISYRRHGRGTRAA